MVLPFATDVIAVTPDNARAMPERELVDEIRSLGYPVYESRSFYDAVDNAVKRDNDMILAFGSLSYLGDLKESVLQWKKEHENV